MEAFSMTKQSGLVNQVARPRSHRAAAGMFGLAIWDVRKERLVVARDAMGIKLIYYRLADGQLTFGSEVRAVLAADKATPEVDPHAVSLFLRFRYTPSPYTIFKGIRKLAPGSMLVVEIDARPMAFISPALSPRPTWHP